ncbi:hypothetical protein RI367_005179 [Sorochytrium milnesiophthora]
MPGAGVVLVDVAAALSAVLLMASLAVVPAQVMQRLRPLFVALATSLVLFLALAGALQSHQATATATTSGSAVCYGVGIPLLVATFAALALLLRTSLRLLFLDVLQLYSRPSLLPQRVASVAGPVVVACVACIVCVTVPSASPVLSGAFSCTISPRSWGIFSATLGALVLIPITSSLLASSYALFRLHKASKLTHANVATVRSQARFCAALSTLALLFYLAHIINLASWTVTSIRSVLTTEALWYALSGFPSLFLLVPAVVQRKRL